ncbi:hypothetical protein LOTGIDRAFT_157152 [Lottia gigantea]|uniref:DUF7869 domain-containing protein n=1 Tax=Lottia gigantea TaxID=225164 RepID=V4B3Q5_LOTGI|nr:hypothetical protein LOTGIDRAFT_157152 [Lottia gigantea]ESP02021.1 hypothetical protein LOTGIDRAFT_157152 [Lottia gigantea]
MEKKSGGRQSNTQSFVYQDACDVVKFLTNNATDHALVLPGRIPGYKRDDIKLLPSLHTKVIVYDQYKTILEKSDENKSERVRLQEQQHLYIVQQERSLYNAMVSDAKSTCKQHGIMQLTTNLPCSRNLSMHYSFDYAQQVHLPSNPMQPGPLYFLVPRKVEIFGVCCEGIPKQVNFLVDEGHLISKGSNAVISYMDFYFDHYGIGETVANLHCNNCSSQNKNRCMIWYCAWRVAKRLHHSISLNFLIAGHTKFAPDWYFGLMKKSFRRHSVPALSVLQEGVNLSSSVNVAQVVGTEDGTTIVPVYDWQNFFAEDCQPLPGIKSYQHFRFDCQHPGTVFAKSATDSEEKIFYILKNNKRG